ncbi:MAG: hypothetical protein ACI4PG_08800 [Candidatus Ventricola sp.]
MKREDWQRVYAPRGDALERRVQRTLRALDEQPERRIMGMKKTMATALAAVLLIAATAALAAGLAFSPKADAKTEALRALAEQYGFTPEMEAFFACEVSDDGRTAVFTPVPDTGAGLEDRLGDYTVDLRSGRASWSHDGETVGSDAGSPVWDTALLADALARKTAGEEWIEIMLPPQQLEVNVTPEQAIAIACEAIAARYGTEGLTLDEDWGAHLYYRDVRDAARDGLGGKCYQVRFTRGGEAYAASLYAGSGEVFDCRRLDTDEGRTDDGGAPGMPCSSRPGSEEAEAAARLTPEQAQALAREAVVSAYGLNQAQADGLQWQEDYAPSPYHMQDGRPVIEVVFWLWLDGNSAPFSQGDGLYTVDVNAVDGTIESILYDSTLMGNG